MICMKNLRFSSLPRAKVRCQGPPGSARAAKVLQWAPKFCLLLSFEQSDIIQDYHRYFYSDPCYGGKITF